RSIVGWFDHANRVPSELEQIVVTVQQILAHGRCRLMWTQCPLLQSQVDLTVESPQVPPKRRPPGCSVANPVPMMKQLVGEFLELLSHLPSLSRGTFRQGFEVSLEVSPAPLMDGEEVVHLRPIAGHDTRK